MLKQQTNMLSIIKNTVLIIFFSTIVIMLFLDQFVEVELKCFRDGDAQGHCLISRNSLFVDNKIVNLRTQDIKSVKLLLRYKDVSQVVIQTKDKSYILNHGVEMKSDEAAEITYKIKRFLVDKKGEGLNIKLHNSWNIMKIITSAIFIIIIIAIIKFKPFSPFDKNEQV